MFSFRQLIMAIAILLGLDYLYWVDSDHGSVTRIKRYVTGREVVVERLESVENIAVDWFTGISYFALFEIISSNKFKQVILT